MRRSTVCLFAVCLSACGGSSSPPSPTNPTPQPQPPAAQSWSLAGSVVDVITGAPIPGASVAFSNQTLTSGGDGGWTLTGTGSAAARQGVTVSAAGYMTYETGVRWEQAGRRDIQLRLIPDRAPFSL